MGMSAQGGDRRCSVADGGWGAGPGMAGAAALCLAGTASAAGASVSPTPANTPQLNATGVVEQVRQLVQCGSTMYAVGKFTSIKHNSIVYARSNPATTRTAPASAQVNQATPASASCPTNP